MAEWMRGASRVCDERSVILRRLERGLDHHDERWYDADVALRKLERARADAASHHENSRGGQRDQAEGGADEERNDLLKRSQ
jgi:hypothetical protein